MNKKAAADIIFLNGHIATINNNQPFVSSVAIKDGVLYILAVMSFSIFRICIRFSNNKLEYN